MFTLSKIITVEWVPPPSTPPYTTVSPILTPPPKISNLYPRVKILFLQHLKLQIYISTCQNIVFSTPADIKDGLIWSKVCLRLVLVWRRFETDWMRDSGLVDREGTATLLLPWACRGYAGKVKIYAHWMRALLCFNQLCRCFQSIMA